MDTLTVIRILNAALILGVNGLPLAREIGAVLEKMQLENRPVSEQEWDDIENRLDMSDARVAQAIENAQREGRAIT